MKALLCFLGDSFLLVAALCFIVLFGLIAVLMLHMGGIISAEPVIVIMDHVVDGSIRWLAEKMFP